MKKVILIVAVALSIVVVAIIGFRLGGQFRYVGEDEIGKWYFDRTSLETRIDAETGTEIIDVWMRRDIKDPRNACGTDNLLWHVDYANSRYKISDAVAVNRDGQIAET